MDAPQKKRSAQSWISGLLKGFAGRSQKDREQEQAIEFVVDIADSRIRLVSGYRKKLVPPIEAAMQYSGELVSTIPGPLQLHPAKYSVNPTLRAVFLTSDQLAELLSHTLRNSAIQRPPGDEYVALLTMSKKEKTIYGHQRHGEMTLRDVPMDSVTFFDHLIVAPTPSLDQTVSLLKQKVLEILALDAMDKINTMDDQLSLLREELVHLASMRRILRGRNKALSHFAPPSHTTRRKIAEIDKAIGQKEEQIVRLKQKAGKPEDSFAQLAAVLSYPEKTLKVDDLNLDLDWMNVTGGAQETGETHTVSLADFSLGELHRQGIMVRFHAS